MTNTTQSTTDAELVEERDRLRRINKHAKQALIDIGINPDQRADDGSMPATIGEHIRSLGAALREANGRIEALSAEVAELELAAETARAQAKSALALLEPLRASRREYGEFAWQRGFWFPNDSPWEERMHADLDALEREGK